MGGKLVIVASRTEHIAQTESKSGEAQLPHGFEVTYPARYFRR